MLSPGIPAMDSSPQPRRRLVGSIGCLLLVLIIAAIASLQTTSASWDGGFYRARYVIRVEDPAGQPLQGVEFRVLGPSRRCHEDGLEDGMWPVYEAGGRPLETDARGELVVHQPEGGLQYGGARWRLFWIIPVGHFPPEFSCEFRKTGYRVTRMPFDEFNSRASDWYDLNDRKTELGPGGYEYPVVHIRLVLTPE